MLSACTTPTQSSGHVEVCDTMGSSIYTIISPHLAASQPGWVDSLRAGPCSTTYAGVFFTGLRVRDKKWVAELLLVDLSGRVTSFLVSHSGYQVMKGWTEARMCSRAATVLGVGCCLKQPVEAVTPRS